MTGVVLCLFLEREMMLFKNLSVFRNVVMMSNANNHCRDCGHRWVGPSGQRCPKCGKGNISWH